MCLTKAVPPNQPRERVNDAPLTSDSLPVHKRRKRTIIAMPEASTADIDMEEKLDSLHGMASVKGVSDRSMSRGASYARNRARKTCQPLPASDHVYKKDASFVNYVFEGDFEARDFPISGDGYAYFVKDSAAFFKKIVYISGRYVLITNSFFEFVFYNHTFLLDIYAKAYNVNST